MNTILWVVALIVLGTFLAAVEVLVIPGFGVAGLLALATLIGAAALAYLQLGPLAGALAMGAGAVLSGLLFWLLPRTRLARQMVLDEQHRGDASGGAFAQLAGRSGLTLTPLRPAGTAEIDGKPVDVVADGQYVEAGTRVHVVRVEGARVVVIPATAEEDQRTDSQGENP